MDGWLRFNNSNINNIKYNTTRLRSIPKAMKLPIAIASSVAAAVATASSSSCRFAQQFTCADFADRASREAYLDRVAEWEGRFAVPGVGYDAGSGYTYDGHPIEYGTGQLYGEPHMFSAPSKESIHVGLLALAMSGNERALTFCGGRAEALRVLRLKMDGYERFNQTYPGFGCFTPWVGFDTAKGEFHPLDSWSHKVPGLDNGEWFWALYAVAEALHQAGEHDLAARYDSYVACQKKFVKMIFYHGDGGVSDVVTIDDPKAEPYAGNYHHIEGYLDDPYEGETMTQMLYLFSEWETDEERELLWSRKRPKLRSVQYKAPDGEAITVQEGYWFSSHEQWKVLLMPYFTKSLQLVKNLFYNAEVVRTMHSNVMGLPGLLASINDVTDGSQDIPVYISAAGVQPVASQRVDRTDVMTPYGSYAIMMHNLTAGLCWYNNMLRGPRMQSAFGSTEGINANGTEISPLTTWDSKITTVLAMLGGVGPIVEQALRHEKDAQFGSSFHRFTYVVQREHAAVFGSDPRLPGSSRVIETPLHAVPADKLSDWELDCKK